LSKGWRFRFGDVPAGVTNPAFDDSDWQSVSIPHTWNRVGSYTVQPPADADTRRGSGWYRLKIDLPGNIKQRRQFLEFDGVSILAEVWVNGVRVGEHRGAYQRFRFDITDKLQPGTTNLVVVRADNSKPEPGSSTENVIPLGGDYFVYGGIYRAVSLVSTDAAQIDMLDHGGPGVYIRTRSVGDNQADVEVLTRLRNLGTKSRKLQVATTVMDAGGNAVATDSTPVTLDKMSTSEVRRTLALQNPRHWQGRADPYLYRVAVELRDGTQLVDRVVQSLGIRTFVFDPDRGFILNGKSVPLRGVSRHQDREGDGWAISPEDHAEDMALIAEMGANTIRQAHYQQAQEWSDAADGAGMAVWAELPFTHQSSLTHDAPTPALIENAKEQLIELIRQNYNHPSIMIWGIGNEIDIGAVVDAMMSKQGHGKSAQSLGMLRVLNELAHQEDDTRLTAYADCCDSTAFSLPGMEVLGGATDMTAYNRYFGWYYGKPENMGAALDSLHAKRPKLPIGVSEFGAGGAFSQHTDNPEGGPVNAVGRPHPEEYQSWYHEKTWPILAGKPYLAASWIWNMFDFSSRREEGEAYDLNDKGLVSFDRKTRKDAFYFYKANWSNEPVLYITGRRYVNRAYPVVDVRAYSNASKASLSVNGKVLAEVPCPEHICVWSDVRLAGGANTISVRANVEGRELSDTVAWNSPDPASGLNILAGTLTGVTTADGVRFGSDDFFVGGAGKALTPFLILDAKNKKVVGGTSAPELYQAYREGSFSYELPLPAGKWNVTLHMFEPDKSKVETRTFDVALDGKTVLHDFNPAAAAGGALQAVTRTFSARVKNGKLQLAFIPRGGNAVISAITVTRQGL
jgi:beta-galactosidase